MPQPHQKWGENGVTNVGHEQRSPDEEDCSIQQKVDILYYKFGDFTCQ